MRGGEDWLGCGQKISLSKATAWSSCWWKDKGSGIMEVGAG